MPTTGPAGDPHTELPLDPDLPGRAPLPAHRRAGLTLAVFAGGMLGATARSQFSAHWPTPAGGWPWATFSTNLVGALALGLLLEALARAGTDDGTRRVLRLLIGTGALGAFTTYSTLAVEADLLVRSGDPLRAAGYTVASVLGGLVAAAAGIVLAAAGSRWRRP